MKNDNIIETFKNLSPEAMANLGLLTPARKSGYICPRCGNGTGDDGTGIDFSLLNDGYHAYCFKCHETFDNIDILALKHNLNVKDTADFITCKDYAAELLGENFSKHDIPRNTPTVKEKKDYTKLIKKAQADLQYFLDMHGGEYRGLTAKTFKEFNCGYLENFGTPPTSRLILPTSANHLLARLVDMKLPEISTVPEKQHLGSKEIFGLNVILNTEAKEIFIVEGEFDAMSIHQCGFYAISFSGADISNHQQSLLQDYFKADTKFIVLFDNDETGKTNSEKVAQIIRNLGYEVAVEFLSDKYKDANEFLQADSHVMSERLIFLLKYANYKTAKYEENENDLNAPIDFTTPENFEVSKDGVYYTKKNKTQILDVPIIITSFIQSDSNDAAQVELAIYNKKHKNWQKHIVNRIDIADSKKLLNLANFGVNITSETAKILSKFFAQYNSANALTIPELTVYEMPGWNGNNFIYPGQDMKDGYIVRNSFDYHNVFACKGNGKVWLEYFKAGCENSLACRVAYGFALAAPMLSVVGCRNLQLALIAKSGSGKSAIAGSAVSIYGNPARYKKTFNGTANFADDLGWRLKDLPSWIDEFQAGNKYIRESIQDLIYNFAEGVTRGRLNRNAEVRPQKYFSGTRILTAEQPILQVGSSAGALARLIELNLNTIDSVTDGFAQELHRDILPNHYGLFGKDWIKYIKANMKDLREKYQKLLDVYQNYFGSSNMPAHIQAMAVSNVALITFAEQFDIDLKEQANQDAGFMLANILPSMEDVHNAKRALKCLQECMSTHEKYFKRYNPGYDKDNMAPQYLDEQVNQPPLGIIFRNGDVGFYPSQLKKLLEDTYGFSSAQAVINQFAQEGILQANENSSRRYQVRKRIGDNQVFLYVIPKFFLQAE